MIEEQPPTELREAVVAVWARLVERPTVGMSDNFFVGGGNSLLAVQLIQELQAAFDIRLKLVDFFEAPTPIELSRLIHQALERELDDMSDAEVQAMIKRDLP